MTGEHSREFMIDLYRGLLRVRMVEEEIASRYGEKEMRCPVHLSVGQEAAAVGACAALKTDDVILSTHRSHAHYLAKGGDLKAMLAEIYGKETGCCGGRGGSMHLVDLKAGVLAALPIVGGSIPIGVGAAFTFRNQGKGRVSMVFFGDAAVEEGAFHESANFASVHNLPVIFVCENNLYSVYTGYAKRQPSRPITDLAEAHGVRAASGNGNDVLEVYRLASEAVARARAGEGPTFLELATYRWLEHCGPNYDNDLGYRSSEEFENWRDHCPLKHHRRLLKEMGLLSDEEEATIRHKIQSEIKDAFKFAELSPLPATETAGDHVYA
ncbi:MAG: acetoin dehydrogenase [Rhodospirillales bacterium RIFCSPLOWO2_12_FULL_58_28]|nr:MAG: acetoin dehydrogenase [Rhodospirillales bacterium RIFCSPLOWO2_02_FULL_58_16]OHC79551.1 MAG: acetoin dehydrogenase [Rhodospirillales bacterium RIFCSPLOWO2_12_FULL_58_28]